MKSYIQGVACRFPESEGVAEFWQNLLESKDMLTSDDRRYPVGLYSTPPRIGKVPDFQHFDQSFFRLIGNSQLQRTDPQQRKLLEVSLEAWVDSGIDPSALRGSNKVGVYVAAMNMDAQGLWTRHRSTITGHELLGCANNMLANRISYFYDFHGPSLVIDTACSSSLVAMNHAIADITSGRIDVAMIGGVAAIFSINLAVAYAKLGITSKDGSCNSFDASACGTARSEGAAFIVITRPGLDLSTIQAFPARPPYAAIKGIRVNNDGWTAEGISFPNPQAQAALSLETCQQHGVKPLEVKYIECHGTATVAGDGQELNALDKVYGAGAGRSAAAPLLIGSVKSNMGHTEPVAGLASLIKVCLSMSEGVIPANLNYRTPNPKVPALAAGLMQPVVRQTPWTGGIMAISGFGIGGTNAHVLVSDEGLPTKRAGAAPLLANGPTSRLPAVLPLASRTEAGLQKVAAEALGLVKGGADVRIPLLRFGRSALGRDLLRYRYRACLVGDELSKLEQVPSNEDPKLCFAFCGNGSQWAGMARPLLTACPTFAAAVRACADVLRPLGFDLMAEFASEKGWSDARSAMLGLVAVQIGLVDVLKLDYGIEPDFIFGHSAGEVACGYADGALDLRQTILVAYHRGTIAPDNGINGGLMAAVGLSVEEAEKAVAGTPGVVVACDNGPSSVTLSGPKAAVEVVMAQLTQRGVFVRAVDTYGVPYHSPALQPLLAKLHKAIKGVVPNPKPRSKKWLSTCVTQNGWEGKNGYAGADYQVAGYANRVQMRAAVAQLPANAVVLEVGPHHVLQAALRQCAPQLPYSCTMKKGVDAAASLPQAVASLWLKGVSPNWPVPADADPVASAATPRGLSQALVAWDHSREWAVPSYLEEEEPTGAPAGLQAFSKEYDFGGEHAWMMDHVIDGRFIMPATSYVVLAWEALAAQLGRPAAELAVVFETVSVHNAVAGERGGKVTLVAEIDAAGHFEIRHQAELVCDGRIQAAEPQPGMMDDEAAEAAWQLPPAETVDGREHYARCRRMGYDFGPAFRTVPRMAADERSAQVSWSGNWVLLLDSLLMCAGFDHIGNALRLPIHLGRISIFKPQGLPAARLVNAEMDWELGTVRTCLAEVKGLRLLTVNQRQNRCPVPPSLEYTLFVPYGTQVDESAGRRRYVRQMSALARELLQDRLEGAAVLPAHLRKVLKLLETLPDEDIQAEALQLLADKPEAELARQLITLSAGPDSDLEAFMRAPRELLGAEKLAEAADPLLGGFGDDALRVMLDIVAENMDTGLSVCELAAGSGAFTKKAVPMLLQSADHGAISYVAADPSPASAEQIGKVLYLSKLKFQVWDPLKAASPAPGEGYGLILAHNRLHTATDLPAALATLHASLQPGGFLCFSELTGPLAACLWGLEPGFWATKDARAYGSFASMEQWHALLQQAGFGLVRTLQCGEGSGALFLARRLPLPAGPAPAITLAAPRALAKDDAEMQAWLDSYRAAFERAVAAGPDQRIWVHGSLADSAGLMGLMRCVRYEPGGQRMHCVFDAGSQIPTAKMLAAAEPLGLVMNVFQGGVMGSYRRLALPASQLGPAAPAPGRDAVLQQAVPGDLRTLGWADAPAVAADARATVTCRVSHGALNFKDFKVASGKVPQNAAGLGIGLEFSGTLAGAGTRVCGLAAAALATHCHALPHAVWKVPDNWTAEEAATVPAAYAIAYYALVIRADIQSGQTVLVLSGGSAVGSAAIRIALTRGCRVFATAGGSKRKQALLRRFPGLAAAQVVTGGPEALESAVLTATGGVGVDVALNTMTGDTVAAAARCTAPGGCLLELSRVRPARKEGDLTDLLDRRTFEILDIEEALLGPRARLRVVRELHQLMAEGIASGEVVPLPFELFSANAVGDAFRSMGASAYSGKRIIDLAEAHAAKPAASAALKVKPRFCARPDRSYIVIGGLGGFGLALVEWLYCSGARHVVVTSRSGITTGFQGRLIATMRRRGTQVEVSKLDITRPADAQQLVALAQGMAPLAGVFGLAMVINDKMLQGHTGASWNASAKVKCAGATHLDAATRAVPTLEHFVMFSSVTAAIGNAGQSNYGFGNSFMDHLCERRRAEGLPGLSIQWGVIGDVGFLADRNVTEYRDLMPQPVDNCLEVLGQLLAVSSRSSLPALPAVVCSYVNAHLARKEGGAGAKEQAAAAAAGQAAGGPGLVALVLETIGLQEEEVRKTDNLSDLGVDSMQMIEVRSIIEKVTGKPPVLEKLLLLTIEELHQMEAAAAASAPAPAAAPAAPAAPAAEPIPATPAIAPAAAEQPPLQPATPQPMSTPAAESSLAPPRPDSPLDANARKNAATVEKLAAAVQVPGMPGAMLEDSPRDVTPVFEYKPMQAAVVRGLPQAPAPMQKSTVAGDRKGSASEIADSKQVLMKPAANGTSTMNGKEQVAVQKPQNGVPPPGARTTNGGIAKPDDGKVQPRGGFCACFG